VAGDALPGFICWNHRRGWRLIVLRLHCAFPC
jgi:hypothetical protein